MEDKKKEPCSGKALIELLLSMVCMWSLSAVALWLSRYFEDMSGGVLFISGLLIGQYLQEDHFKI